MQWTRAGATAFDKYMFPKLGIHTDGKYRLAGVNNAVVNAHNAGVNAEHPSIGKREEDVRMGEAPGSEVASS
eukprot:2589949-Pyramimonas_sp.AAC.1